MSISRSLKKAMQPVQVRRTEFSGAFGDEKITTTLMVDMEIQPADGETSFLLPEGIRTQDSILVYSLVELKACEKGQEPDIITHDNKEYLIKAVKNWKSHFESLAERIDGI